MSTKTSFKRIALVAIAALGLGVLAVGPTSAAITSPTVTLSGTTTGLTAVVNESTTAVTAAVAFFNSTTDTVIVGTSVTTSSGGTAQVRLRVTETVNVTTFTSNDQTAVTDTATAVVSNANSRATYSVQAYGFTAVGTYTINVLLGTCPPAAVNTCTSATMTVGASASYSVVVTAGSTEPTSIKTYTTEFTAGGLAAAAVDKARLRFASRDSEIVVSTGTAGTYTGVAYVFANVFASNSETTTGTAKTNICSTACTVNVTIDRGYIDNARGNSPTASETMTITNTSSLTTGESLVVYSAGNTAGVGTLTYRLASNGLLLGTSTVTFTGDPASVSQLYSNDTITSIGATLAGSRTLTLNAIVKDSGATTLKSGTVWVYSSDTKVAGSRGATATTVGQSCSIGSTGVAACGVNINDTGTATLTIRDSHTVAASTWVSSGWEVTVTGETIKSGMTVAFDKTSYAPGERAVITITAKDAADLLIATNSNMSTVFTLDTNRGGYGYETNALYRGTQSALDATKELAFVSYMDSGVETRVITMPTSTGNFSYGLRYTPFGATVPVTVTGSTTVNDPAITALSTTAAAANAAAEAATDAANEAIDAANAATDAANLSAEAADAATVAAEEARDAADAATAAVEELATQVATLMAALKAQITTLANTVAKIAKKVKA